MKMALQHFRVFNVFYGNLRSQFANFWRPKDAFFLQKYTFFGRKGADLDQRSPPSGEGGDLSDTKNCIFLQKGAWRTSFS